MRKKREAETAAGDFSQRAKEIIKSIPRGKVATYGQIAAMAGNPGGARQVVWLLHSSAMKDKLPWHRVINKQGKISLPIGSGYEIQKQLLEKEGVRFGLRDKVNLDKFLWTAR